MKNFEEPKGKNGMASGAPERKRQSQGGEKQRSLPKKFDVAVIRFTRENAAEAFDVLFRGGQYGVVGDYTYAVTPQHVTLLQEAEIPFEVESAR